MRAYVGVDSLKFVSLDGLYRACEQPAGPRRPPAAVLRRLLLRRLPGAPLRPHRAGLPAQGHARDRRARARSRSSPAPAAASATRVARALGARGAQVDRAGPHRRRPRGPRRRDRGRRRPDARPSCPLSLTDEGGLQRLCLAHPRALGPARPRASTAPPTPPPLAPAAAPRRQGLRPERRGQPPRHRAADRHARSRCSAAPAGRFVYVGRRPRRPALLRRLRRHQGRRRGAGPLLGRRDPRASARASPSSTRTRCPPRSAPASTPARTPPASPPAPPRPPACSPSSPLPRPP